MTTFAAGLVLLVLSLGGYLATNVLALLVLAPLGMFLLAISARKLDRWSWLRLAGWVCLVALGLSALRSVTADYGPSPEPRDAALHLLGWCVLGVGAMLALGLVLTRSGGHKLIAVLSLTVVALGVSEARARDIRDDPRPCACMVG